MSKVLLLNLPLTCFEKIKLISSTASRSRSYKYAIFLTTGTLSVVYDCVQSAANLNDDKFNLKKKKLY